MRIVFVASEVAPLVKTGGLGDVVGALPQALAQLGHEVAVFAPLYACVEPKASWSGLEADVAADIAGRSVPGRVREAASGAPGVRYFLLEQPDYFNRPGIYVDDAGVDYPDNCARFTWLCRAAFAAMETLQLDVDCLHAHDWQSALVPVLLANEYRDRPRFSHAASVLTIHNLAFQGIFPVSQWKTVGLDRRLYSADGLAYHRKFSLLKGGILAADKVVAVSRTYAEEIKGPEFGYGQQRYLKARGDDLIGIVNGIDVESWDPATDPALPANFDAENVKKGKAVCKSRLQASLGLEQSPDAPLLGMVTRLTDQKGLDLLEEILDDLLDLDVQLVILGTGEERYETLLGAASKKRPNRLAAVIDFDEQLSRRIYAGVDMFLMPSQFEPCGLSQLYSLRYGTLPVVRRVGGLADTVADATEKTLADQTATGFQFADYTGAAFLDAIRRALLLRQTPRVWDAMVRRGMKQDWSWRHSAREYIETYQNAVGKADAGQEAIEGIR